MMQTTLGIPYLLLHYGSRDKLNLKRKTAARRLSGAAGVLLYAKRYTGESYFFGGATPSIVIT